MVQIVVSVIQAVVLVDIMVVVMVGHMVTVLEDLVLSTMQAPTMLLQLHSTLLTATIKRIPLSSHLLMAFTAVTATQDAGKKTISSKQGLNYEALTYSKF
mmetsp:Transcript_33096/g.38478  ORF Transcript_33096/g.38478 Transcript_33096/m.38478 type:complete len:100 (-) Transcript_33096:163-462(-)